MSQTEVFTFPNVSLKSTPLEFVVKSCKNSQNTHMFFSFSFSFFKKNISKNFKDLGMVFLQISLNSDQHLNPNIFFFLKRRGILGTPLGFNSKS
jgi:hypothetical protein